MANKQSYLEHAAVTVADIDWSIDFFKNVLGMTETRRKEKDGKLQQIWLKGGLQLVSSPEDPKLQQIWLKGGLQLVSSPEDPKAGQGHHLGIVVQDFEATIQEMLTYDGVTHIEGKPEKWIQLPDGLVLELFQEKPGAIEKRLAIEVK